MSTEQPGASIRKPRVGDVVLYHRWWESQLMPIAAIVTAVLRPEDPKGPLSLTIFHPEHAPEAGGHGSVPFSEEPKPNHWSWRPD